MPVCTSSKINSMPLSSQSWRKARKNAGGAERTPPSLHRLDHDAGGVRPDRFLDRLKVAMRHLVKAVERRPKAFEIFCRAGGGERAERAAVERALERDETIALGMAVGGMVAPRALDRAFHRFRAGIGEKDKIGKTLFAQPQREPFAVRALEQVRHVPKFRRLFLQGCDQMRMG